MMLKMIMCLIDGLQLVETRGTRLPTAVFEVAEATGWSWSFGGVS